MERQTEDSSPKVEQATRQLSLVKHFQVVMGAFIIFAVFTFIILLALPPPPAPEDKLGTMIRYGVLTGIEIVIVLCLQSLLVDKLIEGKMNGWRERFRDRAIQFGIRRPRNGKVIARDTLLLLFCALVPLDLISYAVPEMLGYISGTSVGEFFDGFSMETFLTIGLVYNLITGVKEEFVFRGYFLQRFKEQGTRHTSWILSSLFFGILHVQWNALFDYPLGPAVWFTTAFMVGLLFAGYALNTNRLLPLVLAHGIGNFISAGAIWAYYAAGGFSASALGSFLLAYYGPMLVAGIILAIAFNKAIHRALSAARRLGRALVTRASGRDALVVVAVLLALWLLSFIAII